MKVCICTPSHSGQVCVQFAASMVDTVKALTAASIDVRWMTHSFGSFIHVVRERMARRFLETDCTDLVFIDDDMGWPVDGLMSLLLHDVDVVGAICPRKTDPVEWNVNLLSVDGQRIEKDGLLECAYIGTAMLRIRRRVIEAMPRCFDAAHEGSGFIGEDAWFCREYRRMGGRVWADPNIAMKHVGLKEWVGHYRRDCNAD